MMLYDIIKAECEKRKVDKKFPPSVLFSRLTTLSSLSEDELKNQLNGLYKIGMIRVYRTINDKAIELNETKKENKESK